MDLGNKYYKPKEFKCNFPGCKKEFKTKRQLKSHKRDAHEHSKNKK